MTDMNFHSKGLGRLRINTKMGTELTEEQKMNKEEKIKKLRGEIESIENTKKQNGISSMPMMDEIIEDNLKEIEELENVERLLKEHLGEFA